MFMKTVATVNKIQIALTTSKGRFYCGAGVTNFIMTEEEKDAIYIEYKEFNGLYPAWIGLSDCVVMKCGHNNKTFDFTGLTIEQAYTELKKYLTFLKIKEIGKYER